MKKAEAVNKPQVPESFLNKLAGVQQELQVPKKQVNTFGKYNYRSCEDILEEVKPLLGRYGLLLSLSDEIVAVGERYYVRARATLTDLEAPEATYTVTALAREEESKKGMDSSQITGAASSYARKYALNGLFLIDDVRDSDATNDGANINTEGVKRTSAYGGCLGDHRRVS